MGSFGSGIDQGVLQFVTRYPVRGFLVDLNSGAEFGFPMNPTTLQESIAVQWNEQRVVGMSHPVLQYVGTGSHNLPGVSFLCDRHMMSRERNRDVSVKDFLGFKRFLQSLTVPPRGTESVAGGAPPRVLFVWPEVVSLIVVVKSVSFQHERFTQDGEPLRYVAQVTFSEIRDSRMTSEQLFNEGSIRSGF